MPPLAILLICLIMPTPLVRAQDAERLRRVITSDTRELKNRVRDVYRHPFGTLMFLGVEPHMTVVEIWPGRGWYTEILAPYLAGSGRLYAASWDQDSTSKYVRRTLKAYRKRFVGHPDQYGEVILTELSREKTVIAPPGSADMVLTFRSVHNWMKHGYAEIIFQAMYDALKPGGVLGVVEHRGDPETWQDPQAVSGYVNQEYVIDLAEVAGFVLVESSEVNANPLDTADHPKGVWTLLPSLRLKDQDRAYYMSLGESDRMTLKFIRPTGE